MATPAVSWWRRSTGGRASVCADVRRPRVGSHRAALDQRPARLRHCRQLGAMTAW
jgi:hypothetical protein